jgi:hypothetical protein
MRTRSITAASLALVTLTAFATLVGCAAQASDAEDDSAVPATATEALNAFGKKLVGEHHYAAGSYFFQRLTLSANGKYVAVVKPCAPSAKCAQHEEVGAWKTVGSSSLSLNPKVGPTTSYTVGFADDGSGFKLTRGGATERLDHDSLACDARTGDSCTSDGKCQWAPQGCDAACGPDGEGGIVCHPCDPILACVPVVPAVAHCGGLRGLPCADASQQCVDDPTDGCDPLKGGADCMGICVDAPAKAGCDLVRCKAGTYCTTCKTPTGTAPTCLPTGARC